LHCRPALGPVYHLKGWKADLRVPLLGERETTTTYQLEPSPCGTLVIVREDGFIGRSHAAHGNADNWEKVLSWLDAYLCPKKVGLVMRQSSSIGTAAHCSTTNE
jgi:hypothetical protein